MALHPQPRPGPVWREGGGGPSGEAHIRQEGSRFGATQVTGGSVFQGNFVGLTINSSIPTRPDFAGHFAHAALEPVKAFVARGQLHDQIYSQLGPPGKTQLLLDYVRRHRTEYKATFWIEAARIESLERDFVRLYQTLFDLHASAQTETISAENAVIGVKSWFASHHGPWLMVFDGADTIDDGEASGYIDIKHFIPSAVALDVIVTSRSSIAKDMTCLEGVHVGDMEAAQAVELFQKYAGIPRDVSDLHNDILAIVKELGCLALAVTLAAAYVASTPRLQSNIKAYLPEYRQRRKDLLRRKPQSLVHQYTESVLTTWETSYAAVAGQCVEASVLMTLLSFLSFDDVFIQLFGIDNAGEDAEHTEYDPCTSWQSLVSPHHPLDVYKLEECFIALQKYSLVQWKVEQQSYAVHKLVHAWGHDRLTAEDRTTFSHAAFGIVAKTVERYGRAPDEKLRLVRHIMQSFEAMTRASNQLHQVTEDVIDDMERVGQFLYDLGRWSEAYALEEYVWQARRGLLGEDHPNTIKAMHSLVVTLSEQGQLESAAKMKEEVLEKRQRILGKNHPDTILAMKNLALTLEHSAQEEGAAKREKKEMLAKLQRDLGKRNTHTGPAKKNFGDTLRQQARKLRRNIGGGTKEV